MLVTRHRVPALLAASVLLAAACGGTTSSGAPTTPGTPSPSASGGAVELPAPELASIKIGSSAPSEVVGYAGQLAAQMGYFQDLGITAEPIGFDGDGLAVQALTAGQVDVCMCGTVILGTVESDVPSVFLGMIQLINNDALFCKREITTAADLKDKTVAISQFGGASNASVLLELQALKVPVTDVVITQVGGESARIAALKGGSVDCVTAVNVNGRAQLPGFTELVDLSTVPGATYPVIGVGARKDWIAKNPNTALAVVAATLRAQNLIWTDPTAAAAKFVEATQAAPADADELIKAFAEVGNRDFMFQPSDFDVAIEVRKMADPNAADIDPAKATDTSLLQKLKDLGWYAAMGIPTP